MGKKLNADNQNSEINEQLGRLVQPDEYWALFDLLQQHKWSPQLENKIEQLITDGFFKGEVTQIHSRESVLLGHTLKQVSEAEKWTRQYQILKEIRHGHKTGLTGKPFEVIVKIRRAMKAGKRNISKSETQEVLEVKTTLSKNSNLRAKTELQWIYDSLDKVITRFLEERAHSDLGSSPLFLSTDKEDLKHEALIKLLRKGEYDHTAPKAVKISYFKSLIDSLIKDGRRAHLPGGVELTNEHSRNIFSTQAEKHQSESNSKKDRKRKSA